VLRFLRSTFFLLTLSCLTAVAAIDLNDPGVASVQAKLGSAPAKLGVAQADDAHGKLRAGNSNTAELKDGPDGEQMPLANLVRGCDGDDQLDAFGLTPFRVATSSANVSCNSVALSHPPCARFSTGPPAA
jgi:hypothetical protein